MQPSKCYSIWFSQRNGSTLLCKALESTRLLGKPAELFSIWQGNKLLEKHHARDYEHLQEKIYELGMTANGIFGVKLNAPKKENDPLINELKLFPAAKNGPVDGSNHEIWERVFPGCKHIFLTRRNKVRQAVSWWKAIQTNEWHRKAGEVTKTSSRAIAEKYDFDAIKHLLIEASLRESKIQAFLQEGNQSALTIVYEDFIADFKGTVKRIGEYIGQEIKEEQIGLPFYAKLSDEISDEWTERFRIELQSGWENEIW